LTDEPAHDAIAAAIRAITGLVTGPPNLIGFDFADLRLALHRAEPAPAKAGGRAVFGQGEAEGPDRARRAAEAALADLKGRFKA
jgi:cell division protein FtsZ